MGSTEFTTLSEWADYVLSRDSDTVDFSLNAVSLGLEYEGLLLEAVAMARTNGVAVLFTREASDRLIWHRFHCAGKNSLVAWLLYELEAIGNGKRGRDKPLLET